MSNASEAKMLNEVTKDKWKRGFMIAGMVIAYLLFCWVWPMKFETLKQAQGWSLLQGVLVAVALVAGYWGGTGNADTMTEKALSKWIADHSKYEQWQNKYADKAEAVAPQTDEPLTHEVPGGDY